MNEELAETAAASIDPSAPGQATPGTLELPDISVESYELGHELGRGGMGMVLSARDRRLHRLLAVKISRSASPSALARFAREALLTARLQHPAIVPVHEAGRLPSGDPFYAMKLVAGRSLDTVIVAATHLDDRLALLPRVIAVVEAMAYAHAQRIIHRDLKPANIIIGEFGETIVIDWGLAKELGAPDDAVDADDNSPYRAMGMTTAGTAMGTPQYMAPEQAAGDVVDARADVYGLGAVLYHMLCGSPPYHTSSAATVLDDVLAGPPAPLATRQPGVPVDLIAIVDKAMAREPDQRYADARALAADLQQFYRGKLVGAHVYSSWELARRWMRRNRAVIGVGSIATVALLIVGFVAVWRVTRANARAESESRVADVQQQNARDTAAAALVEQGRQEMIANHPAAAEPLLAQAAVALHPPTPALRTLLADARGQLAAEVARIDVGGPVKSVALSPDGKLALTIDGTSKLNHARLWDVATAHPTELGPATDGVMSADGARIALIADFRARVWAAGTVTELAAPIGFTQLQLSPDGARVVAVGTQGTCVFTVATAARRWCTEEGSDGFRPSFSVDGARVAVAGAQRGAVVHDAATGAVLGTTEPARTTAAVFDATGDLIVGDDLGAIQAWHADGQPEVKWTIHESGIKRFALASPATGPLAIVAFDDQPEALLVAGSRTEHELDASPHDIRAVAMSRDGARAATAGNDGSVRVWDGSTGARIATVQAGLEPGALAFSGDGDTIAAAGADGIAHVWKLPMLHPPRITSEVITLADDGTVAAVKTDTGATLIEPATGKQLGALPDGGVIDVAHGHVLTIDGLGAATVWDATGAKLGTITSADGLGKAGLSPDGGVWTVDHNRHARLWRATGEAISTLPDKYAAGEVTFSGDGTRAVMRIGFADVGIYDVHDGHRLADIKLDRGPVVLAAANHDASRVAIVFGDGSGANWETARPGSAMLWDVATGKEIATLAGGTTLAQYSPDGKTLITGHADGTARLWRDDGKSIATLFGHTRELTSVAVSTSGELAVTAAADLTVRLWDVSTGRLLALHELGDANAAAMFGAGDRTIIAITGVHTTWAWPVPQ